MSMGFAKNSYEKMAELNTYPYAQLLAVGAPSVKFYRTARGLEALCPFHDDKKLGSFSFSPHNGVWKCFACGESGQGAISFIEKVNGWDFLKTVDYLYEHRNDLGTAISDVVPASLKARPGSKKSSSYGSMVSEKSKFLNHDPASDDDRHLIYKAFSDASPLSDQERAELLATRRISYGTSREFFHMPDPDDRAFWEKFRELLRHYDENSDSDRLYYSIIGVPGFYWDEQENRPSFVTHPGAIGMLLHSPAGKIVGIDMRLKESNSRGSRYVSFSSGSICARDPERCTLGASLHVYVDFVPNFGGKDKGIAITEGKFKAIHLSYRGYSVLSVRGVSNWKHILNMLKQLPAGQPVSIAFDADSRSNPAVAKCASQLGHALLDAGYETQYLTWNTKDGKGFDDLCNNGFYNRCRTVPAQRFLETTLDPFLARAAKRREQERTKIV